VVFGVTLFEFPYHTPKTDVKLKINYNGLGAYFNINYGAPHQKVTFPFSVRNKPEYGNGLLMIKKYFTKKQYIQSNEHENTKFCTKK
jgi:hypothetical protein